MKERVGKLNKEIIKTQTEKRKRYRKELDRH